jgi:predicted CXXCH cytochrome family protein
LLWIAVVGFAATTSAASPCVDCHLKVSPFQVNDWKLSKHAASGVDCTACHGERHQSADDAAKVSMPSPQTCAPCHDDKVQQFLKGKHAKAWLAMKAMPTIHFQPMALIDGMKGCGGCHKIGTKSEQEARQIAKEGNGFGTASCDACHTRHTFSVKEARQPQACQTCHMGFDHPQWEMYSGSKHGVRYLLKQNGTLPADTPAPTCQMCHMPDGNHEVRTAWGFLAVRLPMPDDAAWAVDRITILQGLGVLDVEGKPTARLEVVKAGDVARLDQASWQKERDRLAAVCSKCHAPEFAKTQLEKGDQMIREADRLMAEAIRVVAGLYRDGILKKPDGYAAAFPDLLAFHDAPTPIEQQLFVMYLEHRMRAFQGTFHGNPDYALWYGWSEMRRDLTEIRFAAEEMRKSAAQAVSP